MANDGTESGMDQHTDLILVGTRRLSQDGAQSTTTETPNKPRVQRPAAVKSAFQTKALMEGGSVAESDDSVYDHDGQDDLELGQSNKKSESARKKKKTGWRKKRTHQEYCPKMDDVEERIRRLNERLKRANGKYQEEVRARKIAQDEASAKINDLEAQLKSNKNLAEEQDEQICKLQAEVVDSLRSGEGSALPDNIVKGELAKVFADTKSWSETWVVNSWDDVHPEGIEAVIEAIQSCRKLQAVSDFVIEAVRKRKIPPRILLNTIVNKTVCHLTIRKPFQFLRGNSEGKGYQRGSDKVALLLGLVNQRSLEDYHACRVSLLRAIDFAQGPSKKDSLTEAQADCDDLRRAHCTHVVKQVLQNARSILKACITEEDMERKGQLSELVTVFFKKSIELHAQEPHLMVCERRFLSQYTFSMENEYFVAHRMMKLKEDKDDLTGLDPEKAGFLGRPIDLIVEPLIVRFGNADGSNRDKHRVVHKAVVWMVENGASGQHGNARRPHVEPVKDDKPANKSPSAPEKAPTSEIEPSPDQEPRSTQSADSHRSQHRAPSQTETANAELKLKGAAQAPTSKVRPYPESETQATLQKNHGVKRLREDSASSNKKPRVESLSASIPKSTHTRNETGIKAQKQRKASSSTTQISLSAVRQNSTAELGMPNKSPRKAETPNSIKCELHEDDWLNLPDFARTPPLN